MTAPPAGRLHLVPVPIVAPVTQVTPDPDAPAEAASTSGAALQVLPPATLNIARAARYFLAENARSARAFLKAIGHPQPIASLKIVEIGHDPDPARVDEWLAPLAGSATAAPIDAVLVSEAGCPGVADPGAAVVARAHERGITVVPWVGPSSLLLALMGAGMNGQAFRFLGYLPQDRAALRERLLEVQRDARRGETQLFIETPYRSSRLFEALLEVCDRDLRLCLAVELTGPDALLRTRTIGQWQACSAAERPVLERRATVFLLHAHAAAPARARAPARR